MPAAPAHADLTGESQDTLFGDMFTRAVIGKHIGDLVLSMKECRW